MGGYEGREGKAFSIRKFLIGNLSAYAGRNERA